MTDTTRTCQLCDEPLVGLSYRFKKHPDCRPREQERTKTCVWCNEAFTYTTGRGSDREYCTPACRKARALAQSQPQRPACTAPDCSSQVRSAHAKYCEMHYGRVRRTGGLEAVVRQGNGTCHYCGGPAPKQRVHCSPLCKTRERIGVELAVRACDTCAVPLPATARSGTKYCGDVCRWAAFRARKYGVPLADYWQAMQHGCAICHDKDMAVVTDHDHSTGAFRGMLCGRCNSGLGMFRDDTALLAAAVLYLTEAADARELGRQ